MISKQNWTAYGGRILRFVRILRGDDLREMQALEKVMRHWHREETIALARATEASECGNMERCALWLARCHEARLRCNKDFRQPMIELTGKPDLFDANAQAMASPP